MQWLKSGYGTASIIGIVLVVLIGAMVLRYKKEIETKRERVRKMGSQIAETACGPIEYARSGSGYPVLVVHGNGGGFDQGLGLAQGYIDPRFEVIAPSRFGYLRTPLPANATVEMQADALVCLMDTLGIEKAAVLTSSAGATSVLQLALRHPERVSAIILHSPNAPGKVDMALPPQPAFSAMMHNDFAYWALTTYFGSSMQSLVGVPKGFTLDAQNGVIVKETLGSVLPSSQRADGMVFDTFVSNQMVNSIPVDQIRVPALVISAKDDPMTLNINSRNLAESIPGAQLAEVADGGHMMLGHTPEVREAISQFLSKALPE